jgi:hypothetical protein
MLTHACKMLDLEAEKVQLMRWFLSAGGDLVPGRMQQVLAAGERLGDAWQSRGSLWGPSIPIGALLHVQVQVPL